MKYIFPFTRFCAWFHSEVLMTTGSAWQTPPTEVISKDGSGVMDPTKPILDGKTTGGSLKDEPNTIGAACGYLRRHDDWYDSACDTRKRFICKRGEFTSVSKLLWI